MKRALKVFGIVFAVFLVLLLLIPFFVDVDKFRPELENKVGSAINSKVKLGKLSLGLIPSVRIKAETLEVTPNDPSFPEKILNCSDMKISIPWHALIGAPSATLELLKPEIQIIEKNKKYNFETLSSVEAKDTPPPEARGGEASYLQKKIETATLTLSVKEAKLLLKSSKANATVVIDELLLKNLGFNSPIDAKLVSNVEYSDETMTVKGPFEFTGQLETEKKGEEISSEFDLVGDFSKMLIKVGASFDKAEKVPLKFHMVGSFKKGINTDLNISNLNFELASLKLAGKAAATGIQGDEGTVDFDIQNQTAKLEDIVALSPLLNDYKLQGDFSFFAKAKGTYKNPALDIEFKADKLKGKTPKLGLPINELKVKLKVQGTLEEPIVELDPADLLIGKSDLRIRMKARNLKAPDVVMSMNSKSLDLAFLNSGKESKGGKSTAEDGAAKGKALDAALDEAAPNLEKSLKNPLLDKAKVALTINFGELKLQGTKLDNFNFQANYAARNFSIKEASFFGYDGKVEMSGVSRLTPAAPTYDYNLKLQNIDLARAIEAHAPEWKGQISGRLRGTSRIAGAGLRKAQLDKSLAGGISGDIVNGNTSLQLSKILSTVMQQLPQKPDLKSKASEDKLKGKFKTLKMNTKVEGRKIHFTNLDILFEPDEYNFGEVQYTSTGSLTFERYLELSGNVFLDPKIVKWPEAVGKSGKIEIPIKLAGQMDAAKPDISHTVSKMGTRVLKKTVEKEVQKGVQKILEGQKPEDVLKSLFKMK